ncbi:MAG: PQQ-binding-like beta-propeller repeat protein [Calditrichaeota bacterium]|nr:PQQ-binding-like beta-propeller repeat protein [Calditrichota bacterium]
MKKISKILLISLAFLVFSSCEQKSSFRFAWLSDTHVGSPNAEKYLRESVHDINLNNEIDFTIISGDVSETGSDAELKLAKSILDSLKKPYFIIPGNHDTKWSPSGCTTFSKLWGDDKFRFSKGGIEFLAIHQGPIMRMGDGFFSPEDVRWLREQLQDVGRSKPIIFVTHYPLNSSISNWFVVLDLLKEYSTEIVLLGHGHRNKAYNFEGLPGAMGRSNLKRGKTPVGYNLVEVTADSIRICEKNIGKKRQPYWYRLSRGTRLNFDSTKIERPDFSDNDKFPQIKIKWLYETFYTIASGAAVWTDYVVAGNRRGTVYCLDVDDGSRIWQFETQGAVFSQPEIAEGKVVFGSADQHIYCLDIVDGSLIWKFRTDAPVVASPRIEKGVVYCGASDGVFRAIDLESGRLIWQFRDVKDFVECKPLIYQDKVIFGAWDTNLYALNIADGSLAWKWNQGRPGKLFSPAACDPVGARNKVFIVAPDRYLTAIDVDSGRTIWRSNRYRVRESLGIAKRGGAIFAKTMQDTVVCAYTWPEKPIWKWAKDAGFGYDIDPSVIIEKRHRIFFGTQHGYIYSLYSDNGKLDWKFRVGVSLINNVIPLDSLNVIGTDMQGRIFRLATQRPDTLLEE